MDETSNVRCMKELCQSCDLAACFSCSVKFHNLLALVLLSCLVWSVQALSVTAGLYSPHSFTFQHENNVNVFGDLMLALFSELCSHFEINFFIVFLFMPDMIFPSGSSLAA